MHVHAHETELVKRQPDQRQARFYRMAVWPDLFGGYSLAREYGRIGQPGNVAGAGWRRGQAAHYFIYQQQGFSAGQRIGAQQPAPEGAASPRPTSWSAATLSWAAPNSWRYPSRRALNRR